MTRVGVDLIEIERVQRVVEGLLALARDPEGKETPSEEPVDLSQVVFDALHSVAGVAQEAVQVHRHQKLGPDPTGLR